MLEFADAFVRGDPGEVTRWLGATSAGRGSLEELMNTGEWDESVPKIEALRIVYAQDTGGSDEPSPAAESEDFLKGIEDKVRQRVASSDPIDAEFMRSLFGDLPDEAKDMAGPMTGMLDSMPAISDPAAKQIFLTQFLKGFEFARGQAAQLASSFSGDSVTMAIQMPGEAYLARWAVGRTGSGFVFTGLESISEVRARASDFDGVNGALTFAGGGMPTLPVDFRGGSGGNQPPPPPPAGEPTPAPSGPPTKRTPGGPITIPGS
jgi:hypothetical protein